MLWHYRKRADECASRIINTKSDAVRENYERLLDAWKALIVAEEARLSRMPNPAQQAARLTRSGKPHLELVRTPSAENAIADRPVA